MKNFEQPSENLNKEEKTVYYGEDGNRIESYTNPKTKEIVRMLIRDKNDSILQFYDLTGKEEYFDEIKKIFDKYGAHISDEELRRRAGLRKIAEMDKELNSIDENNSIEN